MPRVSVLVSTYNNPKDLELVLTSITTQTFTDLEVIVCDNGSDDDTAETVRKIRDNNYPFVLKHYTHPHKPYWLGQARNGGILASESDYIINIDGDILMHPRFVETHMQYSGDNRILFGGRVKLAEEFSKNLTPEMIVSPGIVSLYYQNYFSCREKEYAPIYTSFSDRISGMYCQIACGTYVPNPQFMNRFREMILPSNLQWNLCLKSGGHWSTSRKVIDKVNGFDERFGLGGGEDGEFFWRVRNSGAEITSVLSKAIGYHLYHPQGWQREGDLRDESMAMERYTRENKIVRCEKGLAEHDYGGLV